MDERAMPALPPGWVWNEAALNKAGAVSTKEARREPGVNGYTIGSLVPGRESEPHTDLGTVDEARRRVAAECWAIHGRTYN